MQMKTNKEIQLKNKENRKVEFTIDHAIVLVFPYRQHSNDTKKFILRHNSKALGLSYFNRRCTTDISYTYYMPFAKFMIQMEFGAEKW